MKVSGFTFLRNGRRLGYPFLESIQSILPICDEFVIALGASDDGTCEMVRTLSDPKIKILETVWNESMRTRGYVYAQQKMVAQFACTGTWAFYLEADEIVHENDLDYIRSAMERYADDPGVEALAFKYHHFFGSPDYVATSPDWYRSAARIIRTDIRSMAPDGLYWVVIPNRKWHGGRNKRFNRYPRASLLDAFIYHYGHVRGEEQMVEKARYTDRYWGKDGEASPSGMYQWVPAENLAGFRGGHPAVAESWLEESANRDFTPNRSIRPRWKHRVMKRMEKSFGLEMSRKHFKVVRCDERSNNP